MIVSTTLRTLDPRNNRLIAEYPIADAEAVARACRSALSAHRSWRNEAPSTRARALNEIAAAIEAQRELFANEEAQDTGKHVNIARHEVDGCVELWRYAAMLASGITSDCCIETPQGTAYTVREPMRVVGMIVPWNYPLITTSERLPFALAAGCSVVLKPSELAVGALPLLTKIIAETDRIPTGLVQTIYGDASTGRALTSDSSVEMISFVGSTATGRQVESLAVSAGKCVSAELGGNNFLLVYADADLERAADAAIVGGFRNAGQACIAATHVLVEPSVEMAFLELLTAALERRYPSRDRHIFQPMINRTHAERIEHLISTARNEEGLHLLPGSTPERRENRIGPVIFSNVPPGSVLMRDEIFGPVLTITPLAEQQFVAIANASGYGLAAYVWTQSEETAKTAIAELRAGRIWINADPEAWLPELPVGGFGKSGTGRELGPRALDTYTLTKSVLSR